MNVKWDEFIWQIVANRTRGKGHHHRHWFLLPSITLTIFKVYFVIVCACVCVFLNEWQLFALHYMRKFHFTQTVFYYPCLSWRKPSKISICIFGFIWWFVWFFLHLYHLYITHIIMFHYNPFNALHYFTTTLYPSAPASVWCVDSDNIPSCLMHLLNLSIIYTCFFFFFGKLMSASD